MEKYLNPHTDFGFKRLFGTELNKELLISFLNALLDGEQRITDVTFMSNEHMGEIENARRAIFDVYCKNDKGEKFIVEMQNVYQQFFKDRSIFYSTFPIREQAKRGDWDFQLKSVYTIGLLNFKFEEDRDKPEYFHHEVKLMDINTKKVFYDKLTFVYVEIPKFNKREDELVTMFDKWMFVLRNLSNLMSRPAALQERVFTRLFETAEIARFTEADQKLYEQSVYAYRDIINAVNTAKTEGFDEGFDIGREQGIDIGREQGIDIGREQGIDIGREQGIDIGREQGRNLRSQEIAKKMKAKGICADDISDLTGLSVDEIEKI